MYSSHVQEVQEEAQDTDPVFCNIQCWLIYKLHFCPLYGETSLITTTCFWAFQIYIRSHTAHVHMQKWRKNKSYWQFDSPMPHIYYVLHLLPSVLHIQTFKWFKYIIILPHSHTGIWLEKSTYMFIVALPIKWCKVPKGIITIQLFFWSYKCLIDPTFSKYNFWKVNTNLNTLLPLPSVPLIEIKQKNNKTNSVAWVCEWTIPIERPPLVGEVSAKFCRLSGVT
jgi:hypothetical protein